MPRQTIVLLPHGAGTMPPEEGLIMGLTDTPLQSMQGRRCRWRQRMRWVVWLRSVVGKVACKC